MDYALAEVAGKLARMGREEDVEAALDAMSSVEMLPITVDIVRSAARLHVELRRENGHASVGDAVMLAAARLHGAVLISGDPCFAGQKDVRVS